jgi:chromosome partitioning protein
MSLVIAIAGQKGGVGKTTLSATISGIWMERGLKVLLVDADPQASARTWGDVSLEAGGSAPTIVAMGPGLHRPDQLPAMKDAFDVVVIDCPPANGAVQRAALMVADLVILPCSPSPVDLWALSSSVELVEEARIVRPDLKAVIVITKKAPRTAIGGQIRESLQESGLPILGTEIHNRVAYAEAMILGQSVTRYARGTKAADEAIALVEEIEQLMSLHAEPATEGKEAHAHAA